MKLKRLIVQGFKSFKDKTTIHFDNGITGIVGPNGCGKSNIVDALFWVMGEQSAKHLRGNSMKDVIFAGSDKYAPGSFAEVSLVLENEEGKHIHIAGKVSRPSEIQLTRKLYRNGETEYRINDLPARLKDIQEVFMDTGAGAKSYSIVAQGEINKLVNAKPEERRAMIEEVAGVTKFKVRRKESVKKIEQTESNLARLVDLKLEIEKNLKSLEQQAEKAEKAKSLKEKIERYDLILASHREFDLLKEFHEIRDAHKEKKLHLETWELTKSNLEISLQDERLQKDDLLDRLDQLQKDYNEESRQLATQEERVKSLMSSIKNKKELEERLLNENQKIEASLVERNSKVEEIETELEKIQLVEVDPKEFEQIEQKLEDQKQQIQKYELEKRNIEQSIRQMQTEASNHKQQVYEVKSKLEQFSRLISEVTEEIDLVEKNFSSDKGSLTQKRDDVNKLKKEVEALDEKIKLLEADRKQGYQDLELLNKQNNEKSKELIKTESRLQSLISIKEKIDGKGKSALEFVQKYDSDNNFQLIGNLIECESHYTMAVQNVLSNFSSNLVGRSQNYNNILEWQKGIEDQEFHLFLEANSDKDVNDTIERLKVNGCQEVIPFENVINVKDESFEKNVKAIFSRCFLVSNLTFELASSLPKDLNVTALISFDGKVFLKKDFGTFVAGRYMVKNQQGFIAQNNEIKSLQEQLELVKIDLENTQKFIDEKNATIYQMNNDLKGFKDEREQKRSRYIEKNSLLEAEEKTIRVSSEKVDLLLKRKSDYSNKKLELQEQEEKLAKSDLNQTKESDDRTNLLDLTIQQLDDAKKRYEVEKESFVQKQIEVKSYETRLKAYINQKEDIEKQIIKENERLNNNQQNLVQIESDLESLAQNKEELAERNLELSEELKEKELELSDQKDRLNKLTQEMEAREKDLRKLTKDISETEKSLVEGEVKSQQIIIEEELLAKDVFERYRVDLRPVISAYLAINIQEFEDLKDLSSMYLMESENGPTQIEIRSYEFQRKYGQDLKDCKEKLRRYRSEFNQLGEINWQAVEDFHRQKLRFDFLREQEEELKTSLNDLKLAIEHIDAKSRDRFKAAFDEVNAKFEKVFPIIFGGGNARLRLVGEENDPENGIDIVAQPPGKKMQNINLMSGGEKALTAVSLIFSIFLVKPSPFCLLDEVDAPLDDANVGRFNELLREMSSESQFILITHNKKTMELNDTLYGVTMQEPGISKAVSVQLH